MIKYLYVQYIEKKYFLMIVYQNNNRTLMTIGLDLMDIESDQNG